LISDSPDLIKDLYWSVKTYVLFGLITFLFGVQTLIYNIESIQEHFYIPLFVAGIMLIFRTAIGNFDVILMDMFI